MELDFQRNGPAPPIYAIPPSHYPPLDLSPPRSGNPVEFR